MKVFFTLTSFLLVHFSISAQTVKGVILDDKGHGLSTVSIRLPNNNIGTKTDSLGHFEIKAKTNDVLLISAIGFRPDSFKIKNSAFISIKLATQVSELSNVTINARQANAGSNQVINDQVTSGTLQEFKTSQNLSYGPSVVEKAGLKSSKENVHFINLAPTGRLYTGAAISTFSQKEQTIGRRYFFNKWVRGTVITKDSSIINSPAYLYNYDKINKTLLFTSDMQTMTEADKDEFRGFILNDNGHTYTFTYLPQWNKENIYQQINETNGIYALYKEINTSYEKANYVSTGLTESGHNYDEYIDEFKYYIKTPDNLFQQVNFKKKKIKEILGNNKRMDVYLSTHADDPIDETLLKGLIDFLNSQ